MGNFHIYSGLNQKVCEVTEQPTTEAKGNDRREFGDILADVVANMSVPVTILNVTLMGAFRSDAHIGLWSHPNTILDCSHWCLPGVPDAWNELVFSHLLTNGEFLIMIAFFLHFHRACARVNQVKCCVSMYAMHRSLMPQFL